MWCFMAEANGSLNRLPAYMCYSCAYEVCYSPKRPFSAVLSHCKAQRISQRLPAVLADSCYFYAMGENDMPKRKKSFGKFHH